VVHILRKRKSFAVHYAVISDAIHRGGIDGTGSIPQMGIELATSSALSQAQPQIQGQQYCLCPLQFVSRFTLRSYSSATPVGAALPAGHATP
jgi:hypothetical protein